MAARRRVLHFYIPTPGSAGGLAAWSQLLGLLSLGCVHLEVLAEVEIRGLLEGHAGSPARVLPGTMAAALFAWPRL